MTDSRRCARHYPYGSLGCSSCAKAPVEFAAGPEQTPPKIVQVLMHEVVKDALADIVAARGMQIVRMPMFDEGDLEAWSVVPAAARAGS